MELNKHAIWRELCKYLNRLCWFEALFSWRQSWVIVDNTTHCPLLIQNDHIPSAVVWYFQPLKAPLKGNKWINPKEILSEVLDRICEWTNQIHILPGINNCLLWKSRKEFVFIFTSDEFWKVCRLLREWVVDYKITVGASLMVRLYEPGREDHEFDPRLEDFFLCVW